MISTLIHLTGAALLPVILAAALYLAEKKTRFGSRPYWLRQLAVGLVFGASACLATEFGVNIPGATVNVRSASPLIAGLVFGGPSGIIAGLIGGVHRYLAVYWGAGLASRLGCTLATILAGFIGAASRKTLFDDKKAGWFAGLAIGLVTEVLHMLLLFVTNLKDITGAYAIVEGCAPWMIPFNALSVMAALMVVSMIGRERSRKPRNKQISQAFQYVLMICVLVAFGVTCLFTYSLQTKLAYSDAEDLLNLNIADVKQQVTDVSDANLLSLTRDIGAKMSVTTGKFTLMSYAEYYDVAEISIIDDNGFIVSSSVPDHIGYNMADGAQSGEFLCLLNGEESFVQSYQPISRDASVSRKYAGVVLSDGGFVQVGYDAARFQRDIDSQMVNVTDNRHIGKNGSMLVLDRNFNIISRHEDHDGACISREDIQGVQQGERFVADVLGVESFCIYSYAEGYYIIAALPVQEAMFSRNIAVWVMAFMEILVFAALFAAIY